MCGIILCGRHDANKPFFTSRGSFWSSCTTELLAGTTEADRQAGIRNRCNSAGYESVALIPIHIKGEIIGLFQFNDKRSGAFTVEKIAQMEDMVDYVAIALAKLRGDEALLRSEQSLLEAQEIACLGSYVYDIAGDWWTGTAHMDSIFGIDAHFDHSAAGWRKLVHPLQRTKILTYFKKNVEQKRLFDKEYRIVRENDGAERWVHWLGRLDYDAGGSPLHMVGTLQDITERKQAEDGLRSYARRLIEMEENLRKKLAVELHDEIGRDLTAISMNLAIISSSMTDEASRNLSARVQDSKTLIKGISGTVRGIMAGLRPPVLDDFGLLAALRWHAGLFSTRTGIAVSVQADKPFPRLTVERETSLFRISQEALMNAAKHADTRVVTISLRIADGMIWFTIVDEGSGFTSASSTNKQDGSGWGMTIMRERAELIGGNFHVDSAPGKGTVVSVNVPLEDN
jgi:PAS domain S-box-containing protein